MGCTETKYSKNLSYDKLEKALITQTKISYSHSEMLCKQYEKYLDSCILRKTMRKKFTRILEDVIFIYDIVGYYNGDEILGIKTYNKIYLLIDYNYKKYLNEKLKIMEAYNFKEKLNVTILVPDDNHMDDLYHFIIKVDLKI